jgi:prepilin-type N-terminal cleavage/methylation domain-containing protein
MHKLLKTSRGFTIVEILVVIVVIGILATLVSMGYAGYTQNAQNKQIATIAQDYIHALSLYRNEHNTYPTFPEGYACLGSGNDLLKDGSHTCVVQTSGAGISPVKESPTLNSQLTPYFSGGKLPIVGNYILTLDPNNRFTGGYYVGDIASNQWTLDGVRHPWFVIYFQAGATTKCPIGPIATLLSIDVPTDTAHLSSTVPTLGYTESPGGNLTICFVPLAAIPPTP